MAYNSHLVTVETVKYLRANQPWGIGLIGHTCRQRRHQCDAAYKPKDNLRNLAPMAFDLLDRGSSERKWQPLGSYRSIFCRLLRDQSYDLVSITYLYIHVLYHLLVTPMLEE